MTDKLRMRRAQLQDSRPVFTLRCIVDYRWTFRHGLCIGGAVACGGVFNQGSIDFLISFEVMHEENRGAGTMDRRSSLMRVYVRATARQKCELNHDKPVKSKGSRAKGGILFCFASLENQ